MWRQSGLRGDGAQVYAELLVHYSEPHRHYHTLNHISDLLAEFDGVSALARHPGAMELAIWFHDAIYDSRAGDNEEKSAELGRERISVAGGPPALADAVSTLIMATKLHDSSPHGDAPLLVDLDLSIFGKATDRFDEYETQIRQEYGWVPKPIFNAKRAEILERFFARARIYFTEHFFAKYEQMARLNLQRSIRKLRRQ